MCTAKPLPITRNIVPLSVPATNDAGPWGRAARRAIIGDKGCRQLWENLARLHAVYFVSGRLCQDRLHYGFESAGQEHPRAAAAVVLKFTNFQLRLGPTTLRLTAERLITASRGKHNHLQATKTDYRVNWGEDSGGRPPARSANQYDYSTC
jgi:hypothetical protein